MSQLSELLLRRLEDKGLSRDKIPHFLRSTMSILHFTSGKDMDELNHWLHVAGWGEINLDYNTFQLMEETLKGRDIDPWQSVSTLFAA